MKMYFVIVYCEILEIAWLKMQAEVLNFQFLYCNLLNLMNRLLYDITRFSK